MINQELNLKSLKSPVCSPKEEIKNMFNMSMSPRVQQLTQPSRPFFQGYNTMSSDCRTPPRTPKDLPQHPFWNLEMQQFSPSPRHIYGREASSTPKYRRPGHQFYDSEQTTQSSRPSRLKTSSGTSFEAYSQQFFSQYRFSITPRAASPTTSQTTKITIPDEDEEEEKLVAFIERLNKVDIEGSEFLQMFPKPEEAIQLVEFLKERVQDPKVKTIWDVLEQLPANLRGQVDMERISFSTTIHRGLYVHSKSSKKLERFKVRTLNLGGVVVKEEDKQQQPAK